jgi:hypothetical protein
MFFVQDSPLTLNVSDDLHRAAVADMERQEAYDLENGSYDLEWFQSVETMIVTLCQVEMECLHLIYNNLFLAWKIHTQDVREIEYRLLTLGPTIRQSSSVEMIESMS